VWGFIHYETLKDFSPPCFKTNRIRDSRSMSFLNASRNCYLRLPQEGLGILSNCLSDSPGFIQGSSVNCLVSFLVSFLPQRNSLPLVVSPDVNLSTTLISLSHVMWRSLRSLRHVFAARLVQTKLHHVVSAVCYSSQHLNRLSG